MSKPDTGGIVEAWREKATTLEKKPEKIKEDQDPMLTAEWPEVMERAKPKLQAKTIRQCIEDIEESSNTEDLLEALADWCKEAEERDKRIMDSKKAFRYSTIRYQLEQCIEELEDALPNDLFPECYRCGESKKPSSDKRYNKGYEWECPDCW